MTEFGLILTSQFNAKWDYVAADASAAEQAGLDSVWLADHLLQPGSADGPIHEAWTGVLPATFLYGQNGSLADFWQGTPVGYEALKERVLQALNP